jgi:ubiquinol-cytochrome c reductase iron-sulfur subunit
VSEDKGSVGGPGGEGTDPGEGDAPQAPASGQDRKKGRRAAASVGAAVAAGAAVARRVTRARRPLRGSTEASGEPTGAASPPLQGAGDIEVLTGPSPIPERRAARWITVSLAAASAAGVAVLIVYALGGQPQLEGVLLAILLLGIGFGFIFWGKYLFRPEIVTEPRGEHPSSASAVAGAEEAMAEDADAITRRRFLVRMMVTAFGALGLAAIFPIRSLGPSPGNSLFRTAWRRGSLVVDETGSAVTVNTIPVGGVLTVFPDGHIGANDAQAILVRVVDAALQLPEGRNAWAPLGNVCYSKLCTHAGCPVGLYLAEVSQLQCPCHYSAFDVLRGAVPVFGPATTPLPQLPLYVDGSGYLRARGDFTAPVGPGFWNRNKGPSGTGGQA